MKENAQTEIFEQFESSGLIQAIGWAVRSASQAADEDHPQEIGYRGHTLGIARYELICDRLDRVFQTGNYTFPEDGTEDGWDDTVRLAGLSPKDQVSMPSIPAGTVIRYEGETTKCWKFLDYLFIPHCFGNNDIDDIEWAKESEVKSRFAQIGASKLGEVGSILTLPFVEDLRGCIPADADFIKLIIAYSAHKNPVEPEVYIGRAAKDFGPGISWLWRQKVEYVPYSRVGEVNLVEPEEDTALPVKIVRKKTRGAWGMSNK